MLQQTQVKTVLPYYTRWLQQFPTVFLTWRQPICRRCSKPGKGLGTNARARNLHRAAQAIVEQHQGRIPQDFAQITALPWHRGALRQGGHSEFSPLICPLRILDGNVKRVSGAAGRPG